MGRYIKWWLMRDRWVGIGNHDECVLGRKGNDGFMVIIRWVGVEMMDS